MEPAEQPPCPHTARMSNLESDVPANGDHCSDNLRLIWNHDLVSPGVFVFCQYAQYTHQQPTVLAGTKWQFVLWCSWLVLSSLFCFITIITMPLVCTARWPLPCSSSRSCLAMPRSILCLRIFQFHALHGVSGLPLVYRPLCYLDSPMIVSFPH